MPPETTETDDKKQQKSGWGSMGLGDYAKIGNMTAMVILILFAIQLDRRLASVNERMFDLISENGSRNEKLTGSFETHIATQIGETRENRQSNERLERAVEKNTLAMERLSWTLTSGAAWPITPKKD